MYASLKVYWKPEPILVQHGHGYSRQLNLKMRPKICNPRPTVTSQRMASEILFDEWTAKGKADARSQSQPESEYDKMDRGLGQDSDIFPFVQAEILALNIRPTRYRVDER